jgi:hypothetical protein
MGKGNQSEGVAMTVSTEEKMMQKQKNNETCAYEEERNKRIQENRQRMVRATAEFGFHPPL